MYAIQSGRRFALDLDGTVGLIQMANGDMQQLSDKAMRNLQDRRSWGVTMDSTGVPTTENPSAYTPTKLWLIFPEFRDIYSIFMVYGWRYSWSSYDYGNYGAGVVYASQDTTTGLDGAWNAFGEFVGTNGYDGSTMSYGSSSENVLYGNTLGRSEVPYGRRVDSYRRYTVPLVGEVSSVRGLRFDLSNRGYGYPATGSLSGTAAVRDYFIQNLHLYGEYSKDEKPVSLTFWHPTDDVPLEMSDVDMGDVKVGSSDTKQFRLKNKSVTFTASDIDVNLFIDYDTAPPLLPQYQLSLDGVSWSGTVSISSLAPGAVSGVIRVRRITPVDAQMSANMVGIKAIVGSWS